MSRYDFDNSNMYGHINTEVNNTELIDNVNNHSATTPHSRDERIVPINIDTIQTIHQTHIDPNLMSADELLKWLFQLKKHQRNFNISRNFQPYKSDSTEYTSEDREKKYAAKTLID